MARILIEKGASANKLGDEEAPLKIAIRKGEARFIRLLMRYGAVTDVVDEALLPTIL